MKKTLREILVGLVITIVGGVIVAWLIQEENRFQPNHQQTNITPFSTTTSRVSGKTILVDNFDDAIYDGKYNTNLWTCFGCASGVIVNQNAGLVRIEAESKKSGGLHSQSAWSLSELGNIQGRMKLQQAGNGGVNLILRTTITSGEWETDCSIQALTSIQAECACSIYTYVNGQYKSEYVTEAIPVEIGEWYSAKIEITPASYELSFYCAGKVLGQHVPLDKDELKTKFLNASFGVYTDTHIVAFIDRILIERAP